jgi:hypothetical protein
MPKKNTVFLPDSIMAGDKGGAAAAAAVAKTQR